MLKRVPLAVAAFTLTAGLATVSTQNARTTLYMVATAHLDTQWNWTVQDTIRQFIPDTFYTNFKYFEQYPDYVFTWEGAIHYMWFKEYHPDDWPTVQKYVAARRWRLAGSWLNAVDTNMPSPESLFRQALYAKRFFRQEFGTVSQDVYLPDCFGFGFALPSIAAHSGLKAFSTQKLTWGRPIPFPIGRWQGSDGSEILAELKPGDYVTRVETDPTTDPKWTDDATPLGDGRSVGFRYFGTGDTGGGPTEESVANVERALQKKGGPVEIKNTSADQLSRDITPEEMKALPLYTGELILKTHGTGCYTTQAAMKRFNRQNELLADDAEKSAVAAAYLTGLPYPTERLRTAWTRFLWHQFHDDLTGTCIPQAYQFSWNDEITSMNQFAGVLTSSTTATASLLNTAGAGPPLVVFNPLSIERREPVEATVKVAAPAAALSVVDGASGQAVPAQILERTPGSARILFMADVPAVGYKVVHVRASAAPEKSEPVLEVTENTLENNRLTVKIDRNGDIASIYDKDARRELLRAPVMLELRDDPSANWPAWEVLYDTVQAPAREFVAHPVMKVIERGPVRAAIEITRRASGSTFVQRVSLTAGGDRVTVENLVDWRSPNSLLKVSFPMSASNPKATYDLGVGVIDRTNNEPDKYEVPAQKWADLTDASGSFGVGIINDSKYGWDKPDDGTLRLTLLHTPRPTTRYTYQSSNDLGHHRFVFAIAGHAGDWRQGRMPARAAELNQPLVAFEADAHDGALGASFSMASLDDPTGEVAITAMKHAEDSDEIVVRLQERYGRARRVTLRMPSGIVAAREINAAEEDVAPIDLSENTGGGRGNEGPRPTLPLEFKAFQPRTIALKLAPRGGVSVEERASVPIDLPFDLDGVSTDKDRSDGDFDGKKHTISAELLPHELSVDGVSFAFGPGATGQKNVLVPDGQVLHIPEGGFTRLYLVAAAVGGDVATTIEGQRIVVREWQGPVGQWWSRLKEPSALWEPFVPAIHEGNTVPTVPSQREIQDGLVVKWDRETGSVDGIDQIRPAFAKRDEIAWVGSHRHAPEGNEVYVASYLFVYGIDLPTGTRDVRLPSDTRLRILAASASREPKPVRPAGAIYLADFGSRGGER
ncbi:MAG TPA: glycoside hydrolase family 38 C-terminal domain-containing protein [Vicinamibacterales bacterium]|nr:glycoside hydrolase family 38 C-terminal domain-containing protein [Vicinamibacterales bacterium]